MIRGTTPTLESILPFDTSLIAEMYVTILLTCLVVYLITTAKRIL